MAIFNQDNVTSNILILRSKKKRLSNASLRIKYLRLQFPIYYKYKKLLVAPKSKSGRNKSGRITIFSKGPRLKKRVPSVNFSFRLNSLFFVGGLIFTSLFRKIYSVVFTYSGQVTYLPKMSNTQLFYLYKYKSIGSISPSSLKDVLVTKSYAQIENLPFILLHQLKHAKISQLEVAPLSTIQFVRSIGTSAFLLKLDTRTGLGLVKLPSGLKKIFSAFSLCSEGCALADVKKGFLTSTKSGDFRKIGSKPRVRGVAKNPVDHPHGGRTNSIKYPRTP